MNHHQSQLISSSKNCPHFIYPHLFLIFHHHRRKKNVESFTMAQHSEFFDDIFHFYNFYSEAFLRLNLFVTSLMMHVAATAIVVSGVNSKAMQVIGSWWHHWAKVRWHFWGAMENYARKFLTYKKRNLKLFFD